MPPSNTPNPKAQSKTPSQTSHMDLSEQFNAELRKMEIEREAWTCIGPYIKSECVDRFVTETELNTQKEAFKKMLDSALDGALRRGDLPPELETSIRTERGQRAISRAWDFLKGLERLDQLNGSHRKDRLLRDTETNRYEVRKRGYSAGIQAIHNLLEGKAPTGPHNGHEMQWFPPQTLA